MIPVVVFIMILALVVFVYIKTKQQQRAAERSNRLSGKQEKTLELLKQKRIR